MLLVSLWFCIGLAFTAVLSHIWPVDHQLDMPECRGESKTPRRGSNLLITATTAWYGVWSQTRGDRERGRVGEGRVVCMHTYAPVSALRTQGGYSVSCLIIFHHTCWRDRDPCLTWSLAGSQQAQYFPHWYNDRGYRSMHNYTQPLMWPLRIWTQVFLLVHQVLLFFKLSLQSPHGLLIPLCFLLPFGALPLNIALLPESLEGATH